MKKLSLILAMVLFAMNFTWAQRAISGSIVDIKGEPLPSASVLIKGTTTGTVSDIDGKYTLSVPSGTQTLVFSFAGYQTLEVALGASNVVDATLSESTLTEVVVTAIGIQRDKKSLGYSATDLKSDDIAQRSESDPIRALSSKVPGVNIVAGGGAPGQSTKINIRGYSSLTGNTQPLFVVDGIPFDNSVNASTDANAGTQYSNRAFDIDPNNIESMTILKGAAAAALYGSRATNGVIVITTKTGRKNRKGLEVSYNSSFSIEKIANLPDYQDKYTQGSSQNYSSAFIGNWGKPFPGNVDEVNNTYFGGEKIYSKNYNTGYADGFGSHPIYNRFGAGVFPELSETFNGAQRSLSIPVKTFNFLDEFFQTGSLLENSLTFNAGGENTGLSATISRMDNKGILPMYNANALGTATDTPNDWGSENWGNAKSSRTSVSFGGNAKLANGLNVSGAVNYVNTSQETPPVAPSFFSDYGAIGDATIFSRLFYLPRNFNLIGFPFENPVTRDNVFYRALDNPIWLTKYSRYTSDVNRAYGNLTLSYDVQPWLTLTAKGGVNTYNDARRSGIRPGGVYDPNGRLWTENINFTEVDMNYFATTNAKITNDIGMRFIAGTNVNQRGRKQVFTDADGIIIPSFSRLSTSTTQQVTRDRSRLQRLYAVYGDLQLDYKSYLFLGVTARNDWSSTLPEGKNSFFYPSVNSSFVFTEAFNMDNSKILSFGKVRASWAQVGNEASPYQTSLTRYFLRQPFVAASSTKTNRAYLDDLLGNPNLTHETTREIEFGTDLRFFRNRIGIDFTWFRRNSFDQITEAAVPASTGYISQIVNAGEIQNKGIEVGLTIVPVKTKGGFTWENFFNFTRIRSLVVDAGPSGEILVGGPGSTIGTLHKTGFPFGQIWGSKNARDAETGQLLINKSEGRPFTLPTSEIIGDPNSDFTLGWRNTFSYKGLSIQTLLDYKQGGSIYSVTAASLLLRGQLANSVVDRESIRVIPGIYGDPSTFEAIKEGGKTIQNTTGINAFDSHFSDGFGAYGADETNVYDATTVRLREVVLGYQLPTSLLKKTPFGSLRISFSGRNLWFFAPNLLSGLNLDPEVLAETAESNVQGFELGATPSTRRWGVNLNVTF
jgi:TonB-linked SusC/RagA family outer membrane protein